jgi:hypothetical protein
MFKIIIFRRPAIIQLKFCFVIYSFIYMYSTSLKYILSRIGGVMVSVLASSAVDRGSGQTKDYTIGICCFSAKHAALRWKSKDWLARNQNNVSEWSDMSTRGLLFHWASTIKSNSACWFSTKRISSSSHCKLICSRHNIAEKLLLSNNHSLTLKYNF